MLKTNQKDMREIRMNQTFLWIQDQLKPDKLEIIAGSNVVAYEFNIIGKTYSIILISMDDDARLFLHLDTIINGLTVISGEYSFATWKHFKEIILSST